MKKNTTFKLTFSSEFFNIYDKNDTVVTDCYLTAIYRELSSGRVFKAMKFKGTAVLGKEDKFSAKKGKHISESRAKLAAYQWAKKESDKWKDSIYNFNDKMEHLINTEKEHIKYLVNENNN